MSSSGEDLLFRPENDHLLFAYFGISLRVRARSQAAAIRAHIALERKLMRAFAQEKIGTLFWADVLVRYREVYVLEYDAIVEVDPLGDPLLQGTHLYCRFGATGPYARGPFYAAYANRHLVQLDATKRTKLFTANLISVQYGGLTTTDGGLRQSRKA